MKRRLRVVRDQRTRPDKDRIISIDELLAERQFESGPTEFWAPPREPRRYGCTREQLY